MYKFQINISSNSQEIKYQNIGRTHTQTDRQAIFKLKTFVFAKYPFINVESKLINYINVTILHISKHILE